VATLLFVRFVVPQLVGIGAFILLRSLMRRRSAVTARIAAVVSATIVAYLVALSAWRGAEFLSVIFITVFVIGHGMAAAIFQFAANLLETESAA
jgi:hypothetical protein